MSAWADPKQEGETAIERYRRLNSVGLGRDWSAFCTVPEFCTTPCIDCAAMGRGEREPLAGEA